MKYLSVILLAGLLLGCESPESNSVETTDADPYIIGTITKNEKGKILVEEDPNIHEPTKDGGKKVFLFLSDETIIVKEDGDTSSPQVANPELKTGQKVKGWFNGLILESYPGKADANKIVILP